MGATRYASVLGLGFGDCGKGHFVDALTRRWGAHTVVRCNGGAQAGHNVVTSAAREASARHHTFSQFGAGTFVAGTRTLLLDPMIVHPTALLVEAEALGWIGIHDALARLTIDAQCRVTTPYHQAAGRLRERLRGAEAHGTCGVGVGETVRHGLAHPELVLRYGDLLPGTSVQAQQLVDRLQEIRETLLDEFTSQCRESGALATSEELETLRDETLAKTWFNIAQALARQCPPASAELVRGQLTQPGCMLFEGAQGVLLDEWRGFHPHTTWSTIRTTAVEEAVARFGIREPIEHYGVLRSYLTRHGAGPLPTHDPLLDDVLAEPHNHAEGWQGLFRRGHPDAVLLRYALGAVGHLSGLLVSHLDVFGRGVSLKWCERYSVEGATGVERLPLGGDEDAAGCHRDNVGRSSVAPAGLDVPLCETGGLRRPANVWRPSGPGGTETRHFPGDNILAHQAKLTALLAAARAQYSAEAIDSAAVFLRRLAEVTSLPVVLSSFGSTANNVRAGTSSLSVVK